MADVLLDRNSKVTAKTQPISVRLSAADRDYVVAVAADYGVSLSGAIAQLIADHRMAKLSARERSIVRKLRREWGSSA